MTGGDHNTITSIIHCNWVVKGLYLHGRSDDNYNQRRKKAVILASPHTANMTVWTVEPYTIQCIITTKKAHF